MEKNDNISQPYVFWFIVVLLLVLSYLILKPYLILLLSAFVLAFLIRPLHLLLSKKMHSSLAAILSLLIVLIIVLIPIYLVLNNLIHQVISAANSGSLSKITESVSYLLSYFSENVDFSAIQKGISDWILSGITNTLTTLPSLIIGIFITFFSSYYILTNWDYLSSKLTSYIPFKDKTRISKEIGRATSEIIYGYSLIAIIEFFIAFIGFKIAGVDFYLLFPFLIAIFAFIPLLGPALVWLPLALYHFFIGETFTATGVVITGLIISIFIDTLLAPKIIGDKASIHPLIMLLGVLGGVPIFGIFGIIIGPLILLYAIKLLKEI